MTLTLGSGASQVSVQSLIFAGSYLVGFNLDDGHFPVVAPAVSSRQTLSVTAQERGKAASPAVEIDLMVDSKSPTVAVALNPASVQVGATTTATFTLSEPAATSGAGAFTADDVTVSSDAGRVDKGTLMKGSGNTYTMVLTARAAGRVTVTVDADKFTDVAGNNNLAATAATLNVGQAQTAEPDILTPLASTLVGRSFNVTGTAEPGASVVVKLGSVTLPAVTATGGTWTASFNLTAGQLSGSQTLSATATNTAANKTISTADTRPILVDTTNPSLTISPTALNLRARGTARVTFTASEPISEFSAGKVVSSSNSVASLSNFAAGSGNSYTATVTANAAGTATFTVAAGAFRDAAGNRNLAAASFRVTVTAIPDTFFSGSVSVSVTDNLDREISSGNHSGTAFAVSVSPSGSNAASCSATRTVTIRLGAGSAASAPVTGLINSPGGGAACVYNVSFPASMGSAGTGNNRVSLVRQSVTSATLRAGAATATARYVATEIQLQPQPASTGVSVFNAPAVTEGETLMFRVSALGPVAQAVAVDYTVMIAGADSVGETGKVTIDAGQSWAIIEVPTEDNDLDQPNRSVRVTLTSASGGATIDSYGHTATGLVEDDDPPPVLQLQLVSLFGSELRFRVALLGLTSQDVRFQYSTSVGLGGALVIEAGEEFIEVRRNIPASLLAEVRALRVRLINPRNATIDLNLRDQLVFPGGSWRFHSVIRDGVTPAQIAARLALPAGWKLHSWDSAAQRWQPHSATSGANTALREGSSVVFRGPWYSAGTLRSAGLGRSDEATLNPGWNIFLPAADALGLSRGDFTATADGGPAVLFDPRLVNCDALAGVLVIYSYNQLDPQSRNGFRLALPCHQQLQAELGYPPINTISENDTLYVWFNNTTPATLTYQNGQYSPTA